MANRTAGYHILFTIVGCSSTSASTSVVTANAQVKRIYVEDACINAACTDWHVIDNSVDVEG